MKVKNFCKNKVCAFILLFTLGLALTHAIAADNTNPLVVSFENVIAGARKNDWKTVNASVGTVRKEIASLDKAYSKDLVSNLDKAILMRDAGNLVNNLVHAIYLAMKDELKSARKNQLKDKEESLKHITIARNYYDKVLSINIARKDQTLANTISGAFDDALKSVEKSDTSVYEKCIATIDASVLNVYVNYK